jgi:hypothetical protein
MKMLFEPRTIAGGTCATVPRRTLRLPTLHVSDTGWGRAERGLLHYISRCVWGEVGGPATLESWSHGWLIS